MLIRRPSQRRQWMSRTRLASCGGKIDLVPVLESGADNTFVRNELSLQVQITEVLALAVAYSVRHNTQAPNAFENTDTLTTINLIGEIK